MDFPAIDHYRKKSWRICQSQYQPGGLLDALLQSKKLQDRGGQLVTNSKGEIQDTAKYTLIVPYYEMHKLGFSFRPNINISYPTTISYVKDMLYVEERVLAKVVGVPPVDIFSLAGARPHQISVLYGQRHGTFDSYERNYTDYEAIRAYLNRHHLGAISSSVAFGEALGSLKNTHKKYDMFDFDLCVTLPGHIWAIYEALVNSAKKRVLVGITHTFRGYPSYSHVYEHVIPTLRTTLSDDFNIIRHVHNYYSNTTLMFRESFILERK